MQPDFSQLDAYLSANNADGYLVDADGSSAIQRYLSGFDAPDPFLCVYTPTIQAILVSTLEYGRAKETARVDRVSRLADYDYRNKVTEYGAEKAKARVAAEWLHSFGVESVEVPSRFPLSRADALRDQGITVSPASENVVTKIRAVKTKEELGHIRQTQRANEKAMQAAESMLERSSVADDKLVLDDAPLTSERVTKTIEATLLEHGCALDETIVASGAQAADPHNRGSGALEPDSFIVIDIFPRSKQTHYHADMTRTFVVGDASAQLTEWYSLTNRALEAALKTIQAGVTGKAVHDAVCDVYEAAGIQTLREDSTAETGFIHSTGHGVGLDIHERPQLSPDGGELAPGNVVTVEPGIYNPSVVGIRIEDLVVVTEDGHENLTEYPRSDLG